MHHAWIERLRAASTWWECVCVLLDCWRNTRPNEPAAYDDGDARRDWSALVEASRARFGDQPPRMADDLDSSDKAFILDVTQELTAADVVHAVAWGLSDVVHHTFVDSWRDELRAAGTEIHHLADGAFYPVPASPWKPTFAAASSKPESLSQPDIDELPHVRIFREATSSTVRIDFRFESSLEAVMTNLSQVGALVPNEGWNEIDFGDDDGLSFPVRPADPAEQRTRLAELVGEALGKCLRLAVLPELCVTSSDIDEIGELVAEHELPHLLVAGSHHTVIAENKENVAVGLLAGHDERMLHAKTVPFTQDTAPGKAPSKEGIRHRTTLELSIFQAGPFRVALPICKELLDDRLTRMLDRLGVNVILVGALSTKTEPFWHAVGDRIARAQALVIVVNNPRCAPTQKRMEPNILVGQPLAQHAVRGFSLTEKAPRMGVVTLEE